MGLFLCFVNDLPDVFDKICKFKAYADDTQLLVFDKDLSKLKEKIENVINLAQNWYNKNGMKNNSSKSEILVISTKKTDKLKINVIENGEQKTVKSKRWIKILGVFIDHILSWSKQINIVKKNATNVIRKIHGNRLQVTQNFAARSILGKSKYESGKAALRE